MKTSKQTEERDEQGGVDRFTVSLFGKDVERMRDLREYMRKLGVEEANRSLLVKLALRAVPLKPDLKKHLEEIRGEDGRRTRHQ